MEDKKERLIAIVGTSVFHLFLISFLLIIYLETPKDNSLTEWGGVPVMFGNVPDAFGDNEPFGGGGTVEDRLIVPTEEEVTVPKQEVVPPQKTEGGAADPIATQNVEETIAIDEAKNKAAEEAREKAKADKIVQERKLEDQRKAEVARVAKEKADADKKAKINDQMAGLFGNGSGDGSRGDSEGEGTQGVTTGNASFGKKTGVGGWGTFDLGGRSLGSGGLVKPSYSVDDYGTVVVDIVVNAQGAVVEASIGKGTNTPSAVLKREAMRAAKLTRFNVATKSGNQSGKITYKFNLN